MMFTKEIWEILMIIQTFCLLSELFFFFEVKLVHNTSFLILNFKYNFLHSSMDILWRVFSTIFIRDNLLFCHYYTSTHLLNKYSLIAYYVSDTAYCFYLGNRIEWSIIQKLWTCISMGSNRQQTHKQNKIIVLQSEKYNGEYKRAEWW